MEEESDAARSPPSRITLVPTDTVATMRLKLTRHHNIVIAPDIGSTTTDLHRSFRRSFQKEHYGSSIRHCYPPPPLIASAPSRSSSSAAPPPPPQYLRCLPIIDAALVAKFRFDLISPWRQFKQNKRSSAACPNKNCSDAAVNDCSEARIDHLLLNCTANSAARLAFMSDLSKLASRSPSAATIIHDGNFDLTLAALLTPIPDHRLPPQLFAALLPFALRFLRRSYHTIIRLCSDPSDARR
jgi:hypothetical protein